MKGRQDIAYLRHFHTIHVVQTKIIQKLVVWYLTNYETEGKKEEPRGRDQQETENTTTGMHNAYTQKKKNLSFSSHQCHDK